MLFFHCCRMVAVSRDLLKSFVIGDANTGELWDGGGLIYGKPVFLRSTDFWRSTRSWARIVDSLSLLRWKHNVY